MHKLSWCTLVESSPRQAKPLGHSRRIPTLVRRPHRLKVSTHWKSKDLVKETERIDKDSR
eukprot:4135102-Amphidinium_carterae.1